MSEHDVDARLRTLFDGQTAKGDPAFCERVIALAAYELAARRARQRLVHRLVSETLALIAVLSTFVLLARAAPVALGFGDSIPLASPAMLGLSILALWALIGLRPAAVGR